MIMQGPATLVVRSCKGAQLDRGKCTVTAEAPSARGFEIDTPGMKCTDLGTEFGVFVAQSGEQEVHVFRGRVQTELGTEAERGRRGERKNSMSPSFPVSSSPPLTAHQAIRVAAPDKPIEHMVADEKQFVCAARMPQAIAKLERWKQFRDELCKRTDLVAYYDFQADETNLRVLRNRAATGRQYDGAITAGAEWTDGRLPGKTALSFRQRGSGVRIDIPVDCKQITLLAWVKLNPLPNPHLRAILTSDTWHERAGSVHWQLRSDTTFDLDVSTAAGASVKPWSGVFRFPDAMTQWGMFAETYDVEALQGCAYFDSTLVGKETLVKPSAARIGAATIGAFTAPAPDKTENADRTLVGRIDELMIFRTVLSAEEIVRLRDGMAAGN